MKQYRTLDLFKFIAAFLIVVIHTAPFQDYSRALTFGLRNIVTVVAVPFFFATIGFLTREKADFSKEYVKRYSKRIIQMYLIWSAVYFIFVIIKWKRKGFSFDLVAEYVKDFFFEGSYQTIWFLPASLVAVLCVYFLHKKFDYIKIFLMSLPVYAITLLFSSYSGLCENIPGLRNVMDCYYSFFDSVKNGVLFGLTYVSLGAVVSQLKDRIKIKKSVNVLLIAAFYILLAVEEFAVARLGWNDRGVDTVLMLVPITFLILIFAVNAELPENKICAELRKYSLLMFLCQRIPLSVIDMFFPESIVAQNSMLYFITVLFSTLLISYVIITLSKKYKIFKYLY